METYIKVAAEWWADKIRNVTLANYKYSTNSSDSICMTSTSLESENKEEKDAIDLFEEKLAKVIEKHIKIRGSITLSVDYRPDDILTDISLESGINPNIFPWKLSMRVENGRVAISEGHNAPFETIFIQIGEK